MGTISILPGMFYDNLHSAPPLAGKKACLIETETSKLGSGNQSQLPELRNPKPEKKEVSHEVMDVDERWRLWGGEAGLRL